MSNFDRNYAAARRGVGADRAIAVDAGLRAYMIRIYNYMAAGVALTGIVSWLTFNAAVVDTAGRLTLTPFWASCLRSAGALARCNHRRHSRSSWCMRRCWA